MRSTRAGLSNLVMWLASGSRKRAAWSMTLFEIGAGATRSANSTQNAGLAVQAGKALAKTSERNTWGGLDYLASDAFVAEEHVADREFVPKDDADTDTPGVEAWQLDDNIRLAKPLEALVARANKVGPGFEREHVAYPMRAQLIAHHRPDDPPINSTQVYDPGDGKPGDWRAGLHGPVRVRRWVDDFCAPAPNPKDTGTNFDPSEETFALLLNATKSGGDNSGWLAAHFAGAEAVLSAERFGFAHPADDGNHTIINTADGPIMEGGLEAYRTKFGSRGSLLYSPLAMSPEQWPFPGKQIFPVLTEIREDYTDSHARNCGKRAPGYKKLVTWIPIFDWGPPTDDPPEKPPEDPPPTDEPPVKPKYPGIIKVPFEGEDTGTPNLFGDPPAASEIDRAAGVVRDANYGERAATVMGQLEATSIQIRGRPALPDGQLQGRLMGETESENLAGLMYGYTVRQALEAPVVADFVGSPDYINSSPNDNDDPNQRWQAVLSNEARFSFDDIGGITGRVPARGRGSVMLMPSNAPVDLQYVENQGRSTESLNALTLIMMATSNADGRMGLGLRTLTSGRIASGHEVSLAYDGDGTTTTPDMHLTAKDASGAADPGGLLGRLVVNPRLQTTSGRQRKTTNTSGNLTLDKSHDLVVVTAAHTITVDATPKAGQCHEVYNAHSAAITIGRNGLTINSAASDFSLPAGARAFLRANADGSGYWLQVAGVSLGGGSGDMLAANNLSDLVDDDEALENVIGGASSVTPTELHNLGAHDGFGTNHGRFSVAALKQDVVTADNTIIHGWGSDKTDGPWKDERSRDFSTSGAGAVQTLMDVPIPNNAHGQFSIDLVSVSSGNAGRGVSYKAAIRVENNGGTCAAGTAAVYVNEADGTALAVTYSISTTNLRISVQDDGGVHRISAFVTRIWRTTSA